MTLSRRDFLAGAGALVVAFSVRRASAQEAQGLPTVAPDLPGSLASYPWLDGWIRVGRDGRITVYTGKAELGQGIATALQQIAAEQLSVAMAAIEMITADTAQTPDEGYTAGSNSMKDSGSAILHAAAQARLRLVAEAARQFGIDAGALRTEGGFVVAGDGRRIGYGDLVGDRLLHEVASMDVAPKDASTFTIMGKSIPRVDIPRKVTGGEAFLQDLRLPGMVHARMVRPPASGARLKAFDPSVVRQMPGLLEVVRDGDFIAVVAAAEYQAVQAARALADAVIWEPAANLPAQSDIYDLLLRLPSQDTVIDERGDAIPAAEGLIEAVYRRPYQMHAAIGPSCAVGWYRDGGLTVWTHTQGVFPLRAALAEMVGLPRAQVHCVHREGSGCYGHNGADDAAADAALVARAMPGRRVRVQWMREEEHAGEPYGPAMIARARAELAGGRVKSWQYDVWSNTHSTRPGRAGDLAPARLLAAPFTPPPPKPIPLPDGGGDRNAIPGYAFGNVRVTHHFIPEMPLRVSALRALGAYTNIFAIESFIDELARAAGADPVQFRLAHLDDPRGRDVIALAAQRFGWDRPVRRAGYGRGFAYARYKNHAAYCAIALEVEVERDSGDVRVGRVVAAVDSGAAVNPDGIRNQIEGGVVQSTSWTLFESVTWDAQRITSRDWGRYPILRFPHAPGSVEVALIDRPGAPFLGTGEAAQGPTAAALANAVADAVGVRLRELPLDPARVRAAISGALLA
jgi:nicotinate dehydrogenase subunit B